MKMSRSPIHFTKKAVNKLFELQDEANLPSRATFSIQVDDLNDLDELIYAFTYKYSTGDGEKRYNSNGFPYILDTETAMYMINSKIDYKKGNFTVKLDDELIRTIVGEA